jgi:hypothetical protein
VYPRRPRGGLTEEECQLLAAMMRMSDHDKKERNRLPSAREQFCGTDQPIDMVLRNHLTELNECEYNMYCPKAYTMQSYSCTHRLEPALLGRPRSSTCTEGAT